jgi:hypothetical protein
MTRSVEGDVILFVRSSEYTDTARSGAKVFGKWSFEKGIAHGRYGKVSRERGGGKGSFRREKI